MKRHRHLAIFMICIAVVVCGLVSCNPKADSAASISTNDAADFTLKDLNGNDFSLSSTKGKVVILDFWATWCPPCRMEIPHFQALHKQYGDKGLVIVGVALDQGGVRDVKPFVKSNGVTYPIVIGNQKVVESYGGVRGIPTTFVIDRKGQIVTKVVGYRDKNFFEEEIKKLL